MKIKLFFPNFNLDNLGLNDAYFIRKEVFVKEQNVPIEIEIDEWEDKCIHVVIYDCDKPAATGRVRQIENYAKLQRICVLKEYRGLGYGRAIIEELEKIAKEKGLKKAKLSAQTHAKIFYEKLGYKQVSNREYLDAGILHVDMEKELK